MSNRSVTDDDARTEELGILDCEECVDPAEAFSVVGNETRLLILEALWRADDRPVSFSDLRREVGMRDSAQFNYHLSQLTDHFVRHADEGYDLQHAGEKMIHAIIAGTFTERPHVEPFEVDGSCVECGGPLQAVYADERLTVECVDCSQRHGQYGFPPGGLKDRSPEEIAEAFDQRVRHLHCLAADGVCPECSGRMATSIERGGECCLGVQVRIDHECRQCGHELCSTTGLRLLDHSEVVTFHRDRGVHLDDRPYWTLPWCVSDEYTRILSEDPLRLAVRMPLDGDELRATLDGDLDVIETEIRTDG